MSIIFDLDQTLVNSSSAASLRDRRAWPLVYEEIKKFTLYEGIKETLEFLEQASIPYCIVTASPSTYCLRVCFHWGINSTYTVCYHDTVKRKPHPDPILMAIRKMKAISADQVISFGDRDIDIMASNAAGVVSVACLWGADDKTSLRNSNPKYIIESPFEMIPLIKRLKSAQVDIQ